MTIMVGNAFNQPDEHNVKIVANQLLKKRCFKGIYLERRWVDFVKDFRDVIVVKDEDNKHFIEDLNHAMKRLNELYSGYKWIGITGPDCVGAPAGYCFWAKTKDLPLGEHKFCIQDLHFLQNEITVVLKSIRLIDANVGEKLSTDERSNDKGNRNEFTLPEMSINDVINYVKEKAVDHLTVDNFKIVTHVIFRLVVESVPVFLSMIRGVGSFTLKLIHEISYFIEVSTPIAITIIELFGKICGAILIIISMLIGGIFRTNAPQNFVRNIQPNRMIMQPPNRFNPRAPYR